MVIWCVKLQAYTHLFPIFTVFSTFLYTITSLTTVTERIHIGHNLSRHQILISKTNVHEDITSALRLTQFGLGCHTYRSNPHSHSYSFTLHRFLSYFPSIMSPTKTQSFFQDKATTKYQTTDLVRSLESTCLYISRGSHTVLLNNVQDLHNIMSLILSSKLHKNIYSIHLRELQSSNEHKGVSDKFMFRSVPHDSNIYLHITYITYTYDVLVTLQLFTFYMYISQNST